MSEVTQILTRIEHGDRLAANQLFPLVYPELRQLAAAKMAGESPDHTLLATGLVHEVYLRLVDNQVPQTWESRGHFYGAAAEAMRRILIEHARRKQAAKRGGGIWRRQPLDDDLAVTVESSDELLELEEALQQLQECDPESAELVKLRVFAGLSSEDAAAALGLAPRTAARRWSYARAWLIRAMEGRSHNPPP